METRKLKRYDSPSPVRSGDVHGSSRYRTRSKSPIRESGRGPYEKKDKTSDYLKNVDSKRRYEDEGYRIRDYRDYESRERDRSYRGHRSRESEDRDQGNAYRDYRGDERDYRGRIRDEIGDERDYTSEKRKLRGRGRDYEVRERDRERDYRERPRERPRERDYRERPREQERQNDHRENSREYGQDHDDRFTAINDKVDSNRTNEINGTQSVDKDSYEPSADDLMQQMMGFSGFSSSKGKQVPGTSVGGIAKTKASTYRQYMNRTGGFNRELSPPPE